MALVISLHNRLLLRAKLYWAVPTIACSGASTRWEEWYEVGVPHLLKKVIFLYCFVALLVLSEPATRFHLVESYGITNMILVSQASLRCCVWKIYVRELAWLISKTSSSTYVNQPSHCKFTVSSVLWKDTRNHFANILRHALLSFYVRSEEPNWIYFDLLWIQPFVFSSSWFKPSRCCDALDW